VQAETSACGQAPATSRWVVVPLFEVPKAPQSVRAVGTDVGVDSGVDAGVDIGVTDGACAAKDCTGASTPVAVVPSGCVSV